VYEKDDDDVWTELESVTDDDVSGLTDVAFDDDIPASSPAAMMAGAQMPEALRLPCNEATMLCLRGPCVYFWSWLQQEHSTVEDVVRVKLTSTCVRHNDLQNLAGDRVFSCDQWFPMTLSFIPPAVRPIVRDKLSDLYEWYLRDVKKLDFNWKWWTKDVMTLSADEQEELRAKARKRNGA